MPRACDGCVAADPSSPLRTSSSRKLRAFRSRGLTSAYDKVSRARALVRDLYLRIMRRSLRVPHFARQCTLGLNGTYCFERNLTAGN
eukprot:6197196-Pleurochrysis_carterae.AAC.2